MMKEMMIRVMTKMMKVTIKAIFLLGAVISGGLFWWWQENRFRPTEPVPAMEKTEPVVTEEREPAVVMKEELPLQPKPLPSSWLIPDVPFTVQAPFAEWNDPIFQDACEEASMVMAEAWVTGTVLTKESAKKNIQALAVFQKKKFGHSMDTSIQDTASLLDEYLHVFGMVRTGIEKDDIKRALSENRLVIVPTDGRKLKNPNFKQPGPPRHMLVIIGYDTATQEFITNDPGTRKGEGYRYPEDVLYGAILDYPTGKHAPVTSTDKVMLTVGEDAALP